MIGTDPLSMALGRLRGLVGVQIGELAADYNLNVVRGTRDDRARPVRMVLRALRQRPDMTEGNVHALRSQVSHLAANWLAAAGDSLWVSAWATKDRDTEAVALVTQIVGQLGQTAADSFDRERWYAANALVRQIVEAHYLMAVFRDDPPQRQRWLDASTNRIEKSFRPSQMRQAGRFRPSEYKQHCEWGGHPNPSARWLLPNHTGNVEPSTLSADLALHLTETVDLLAGVLMMIPNAEALIPQLPPQGDLPALYRAWSAVDPFSRRMQLPPTPADLAHIQNLRSGAASGPITASADAVTAPE